MGKTHGVKGEINFLFDDDVWDATDSDYLLLTIEGILVPFFFEEYRFASDDRALVKFEGIDSQEAANELVGVEVRFERAVANALNDSGEQPVSLAQLVGYTILSDKTNGATTIGTISAIDNATDNLLFVLDGGALIPVADEWITDIDHSARTITMSLLEGLLALNEID